MASFGNVIKEELLRLQIKSPCCKSSFITGAEIFAKSRKNELTDAILQYKERLLRVKKKKNTFFDDEVALGYVVGEENGKKVPVSSGRVCPFCHSMLVRGAFLVCGRANISGSDVHIEMAVPSDEAADVLCLGLDEIDVLPKRTVRRGEILLYYKKRSVASDFLGYIGAVSMSFNVMQDFILNQRRANAVRQTNCDTKNILKSVSAAEKQVEAINAIISGGAFDELDAQLKETAMIRLQNPSEPLGVIAELHEGISRSGVNHRLQKIVQFAMKKGYLLK
jgi:DNA-binding transcriptional regulator WhiA